MQIVLIQVATLGGVGWALPLGQQLGGWSGFGGSQVIERKLGVQPPTEDSECEQQDRYADGEVTIADMQISVVAVRHFVLITLVYMSLGG